MSANDCERVSKMFKDLMEKTIVACADKYGFDGEAALADFAVTLPLPEVEVKETKKRTGGRAKMTDEEKAAAEARKLAKKEANEAAKAEKEAAKEAAKADKQALKAEKEAAREAAKAAKRASNLAQFFTDFNKLAKKEKERKYFEEEKKKRLSKYFEEEKKKVAAMMHKMSMAWVLKDIRTNNTRLGTQ